MIKSGKYVQTIEGNTFTANFDIDGNYPQNKISLSIGNTYPAHWIADLSPDGDNNWEGNIWYRKDGAETLKVNSEGRLGSVGSIPDRIKVWYGDYYAAGGFYYVYIYLKKSGTNEYWKYWYKKTSDHFREVNMEIDYESGVNRILSLNPHSVDNHRPASLPNEAITIESTFAKAGINIVRNTANENAIATSVAGSNARWSNAELHDAMQTQWSKDESSAWALWVLQADKHDDNATGIMFDDIGAHQRCGTALFHGYSGYSGVSAGITNRHKFHTLIHEIGHTFNMSHSWVKTSGTSRWSDRVVNENEARSYMNYPSRVAAGYYGFFDNFEYRFSDQELTFLRHAPEAFVKMGGSTWGTDHAGSGFDDLGADTNNKPVVSDLQLSIRSTKAKPVYDFMEIVNLELELKNVGQKSKEVEKDILEDIAHMGIRVSRNGAPAKVFKPYATPCHRDEPKVTLAVGESLRDTHFLSAGKFGWAISEPGIYEVSITIDMHGEDGKISSEPLTLMVKEPAKQNAREQEKLAADYFTDHVGRTLAMGGTKVLTNANDVLAEVETRLSGTQVAQQAALTRNLPNIRKFKTLQVNADGTKTIKEDTVDDQAINNVKEVLVNQNAIAKANLGKQVVSKLCKKVAEDLKASGDDQGAKQVADAS